VRIKFKQQPFEELQKGLRTHMRGEVGMNSISSPVVSANNAAAAEGLGIANSGNAALLPAFLPAVAQWRVQVEAGFIHKEKLGIVIERPFFSSSSSAWAVARASGCCKWLRSRLGRR